MNFSLPPNLFEIIDSYLKKRFEKPPPRAQTIGKPAPTKPLERRYTPSIGSQLFDGVLVVMSTIAKVQEIARQEKEEKEFLKERSKRYLEAFYKREQIQKQPYEITIIKIDL